MRILIINHEFPYPPVSGVKIRNYNLLRRIAARHQVWLATHLTGRESYEAIVHVRDLCAEVVTSVPQPRPPTSRLRALIRSTTGGAPIEAQRHYSKQLAEQIRRLVQTVPFDIVHIEESFLALYRELIPPGRCKQLLTFHNVCFDQAAVLAEFATTPRLRWSLRLQSRQMRRWEPWYAERFDQCSVVSDVDRNRLQAVNPRLAVDIVPNGVDARRYRVLPNHGSPPTLIFVGHMGYLPCVDAAVHFTREILPRVQQRLPDVELWLVGNNPSGAVQRLSSGRVHVTGFVEDVRSYYQRSTVCVVPLRAGGGTRLKILEAMAFGRPVVSTTVGAEGLTVSDGEHLLIADQPEAFAQAVVRLLTEPALRERIAADARQLVESLYDWDLVAERQMQIYDAVAATPP